MKLTTATGFFSILSLTLALNACGMEKKSPPQVAPTPVPAPAPAPSSVPPSVSQVESAPLQPADYERMARESEQAQVAKGVTWPLGGTPKNGYPQEFVVDIGGLSTTGGLVSWNYLFTALPNDMMGDRVASFGSEKAFIDDNLKQGKIIGNKIQNVDQIANTMLDRFKQHVDFKKEDLAVVSLSDGGPPFGEYGFSFNQKNELIFCITKKPNPSGISGMALQNVFRFYKVQKGQVVKACQRS